MTFVWGCDTGLFVFGFCYGLLVVLDGPVDGFGLFWFGWFVC